MTVTTRLMSVLAAAAAGAVLAVTPAPMATAATATTTTLAATPNPATTGQAVTLSAAVTGASPTGQVTFADSGTPLGTADVASGSASLVVSTLTAGSHSLTASYAGDANNDPSTSTAVAEVVNAPAPPPPPPAPVQHQHKVKRPSVHLTASVSKAAIGDKVRLTWRSKHADSARAHGAWRGKKKTHGSAVVKLETRGKVVFKLTVRNAAGIKTGKAIVMVSRPDKTFDLAVSNALPMVGSKVDITADGFDKAEDYTIRLDGKTIFTGTASAKGEVAKTLELPKNATLGARTLTIVGSNPRRNGTASLYVIGPKKLDVTVDQVLAARQGQQTVLATGLAPGEPVTVSYRGDVILKDGVADADGNFSYAFNVGNKAGDHTVTVTGADPSRTGSYIFPVA